MIESPTKAPDTRPLISDQVRTAGRRVGYSVAIIVNVALLYAVHNLLEWDWVRVVTSDFEQLVGILTFSLGASIVINVLWIAYDRRWFKSLGQLAINLISLAVTVRMYQVFPFDVTSGWETMGKIGLVFMMVILAIASLVELVRLIAAPVQTPIRSSRP